MFRVGEVLTAEILGSQRQGLLSIGVVEGSGYGLGFRTLRSGQSKPGSPVI